MIASETEVKQLSGQIYTALIAHRLKDYELPIGGINWEAMAEVAMIASVALAKQWTRYSSVRWGERYDPLETFARARACVEQLENFARTFAIDELYEKEGDDEPA